MGLRELDPIIHNIDPFLVHFGSGGIRFYSIPYVLGILLVYFRMDRAVRKEEIPGLREEHLGPFILTTVLGAVVGARFFHVFVFEYSNYGFDPARWIAFWSGGMAFHGGIVGVILSVSLFLKRYRIPVYSVLDRMVVPVAIALGFGRIGNFINGEMYGTLYDGPFCVDYSQSQYLPAPPDGCRYPVQLMEMAKNWLIAGFLLIQWKKFNPKPGVPLWTFVGLYGLIRFFLMYLRVEGRVFAGLTLSQIFSGMMALLGLSMVIYCMKQDRPDPDAVRAATTESRAARRKRARGK